MNKKLEPGMVCLIIGSRTTGLNIGKTCTLVEFIADQRPTVDNKYFPLDTNVWYVKGPGLAARNEAGNLFYRSMSFVGPEHLMPLKGDEDFSSESEETLNEEINTF
jgi:hypothetical protein